MPHVFSERLTITAGSPERASRSGSTCSRDHQLHLVRHARAPRRRPCRRSRPGRPGAVPIGFGIASAPTGTSAWRRLFCGMSRPREPKSVRDVLDELLAPLELDAHHLGDRLAGHVVLGGPEPAAHDDRVGLLEQLARAPRPSAAGCRRPCGAPSCRCRPSASCSPIHELFVSTIWPSSSSVPIARTSHRIVTPSDLGRPAAAHDVDARDDRERDRDPQDRELQRHSMSSIGGQHDAPTASIWKNAFHLPSWRGGSEMPSPAGDGPVRRRPDLARGDERDRHPPEVAARHRARRSRRASGPCRRAGRGTRRSGWCRRGGRASRRCRR